MNAVEEAGHEINNAVDPENNPMSFDLENLDP